MFELMGNGNAGQFEVRTEKGRQSPRSVPSSLGRYIQDLDGAITRDQITTDSHKAETTKRMYKKSSFGAVGQLTNLRHSHRAMEWEKAERHGRRDARSGNRKPPDLK